MMDQTTLNRGHLAFVEDQVHAAVDAFRSGELVDCAVILDSVAGYIRKWLEETKSLPK